MCSKEWMSSDLPSKEALNVINFPEIMWAADREGDIEFRERCIFGEHSGGAICPSSLELFAQGHSEDDLER